MKLNEFIFELSKISEKATDSYGMEVVMADNIPVVKPIVKDNKIFITDIKK